MKTWPSVLVGPRHERKRLQAANVQITLSFGGQ